VNRLRRKIDEGSAKPLLQTRRGSGYVLTVPPETAAPAARKPAGAATPGSPRKSHA